ncbi:hypothetical protein RF11_11618 [Thelohanellus kitauei]|uniref:Uncharacterized protein n=1 Tax=Thelohanellus kitauei TaxID=669202 RepID=A0A0C2N7T0_THEKT|nr:hypothetical protein RF11_11618 [Thelohanellus kitauei]
MYEKWFREVESKRIFDMDKCVMREDDHFFAMDAFFDYLKKEGISKENYTSMIISAQCNLENATNEFFKTEATFEKQRDELLEFLISRQNAINGTKQSLIEDFKSNSLYNQETSNRFLSPILQCYLEGEMIDRIISMPRHRSHSDKYPKAYSQPNHKSVPRTNFKSNYELNVKPTPRDTTRPSMQPFSLLILSCILLTLFIVGMKLYKNGSFTNKIRIQGDGIYYDIRNNVITEP